MPIVMACKGHSLSGVDALHFPNSLPALIYPMSLDAGITAQTV